MVKIQVSDEGIHYTTGRQEQSGHSSICLYLGQSFSPVTDEPSALVYSHMTLLPNSPRMMRAQNCGCCRGWKGGHSSRAPAMCQALGEVLCMPDLIYSIHSNPFPALQIERSRSHFPGKTCQYIGFKSQYSLFRHRRAGSSLSIPHLTYSVLHATSHLIEVQI